MAVVVERVAVRDLLFDTPNGKVHFGEPLGRMVGLLAVDADIAVRPAAVSVAAGVHV